MARHVTFADINHITCLQKVIVFIYSMLRSSKKIDMQFYITCQYRTTILKFTQHILHLSDELTDYLM